MRVLYLAIMVSGVVLAAALMDGAGMGHAAQVTEAATPFASPTASEGVATSTPTVTPTEVVSSTLTLTPTATGAVSPTLTLAPTPTMGTTPPSQQVYLPYLAQAGLAPTPRPTPTSSVTPYPSTDISIQIYSPAPGGYVGESVRAVLIVNSLYEIAQVRGEIGAVNFNFGYDLRAYSTRTGWGAGWVATIDLSHLSFGTHPIRYIASDIFGGTAIIETTVRVDRPPKLTVISPLADTVARDSVRLTLQCVDDNPEGCPFLKVQARGVELVRGSGWLDAVVSLAPFGEGPLELQFVAVPASGGHYDVIRQIYIERSEALHEEISVEGRILDVDSSRVLSLDTSGDVPILRLIDRATGQVLQMTMMNGLSIRSGYLTPHGAILEQSQDRMRVLEWHEGRLTQLGEGWYDTLRVKGPYLVWVSYPNNISSTLYWRDVRMDVTSVVTDTLFGVDTYDLAANGDVVYGAYEQRQHNGGQVRTANIFRYRDGVTTRITDDTEPSAFFPRTDGNGITYLKAPTGNPSMFSLFLHTTLGETKIADNVSGAGYPSKHPIRDGWVAYTQPGGQGQPQVWVRAPTGERQQVTFFGVGGGLDALGPNGVLTVYSTTGLYYSATRPTLTRIGGGQGRRVWIDGQLYTILGRSLFRVILP